MMLGFRLGLRTLCDNLRSAALAVVILSTVLTILLVLWGLKSGTMTALTDALRNDPARLEIRLVGDNLIGSAEAEALRAQGGVGYFQPTTRALAARAFLSPARGSGREAVAVVPSGPGDPILPEALQARGFEPGELVVSARAAAVLRLSPGDDILLSTRRESDGVRYGESLNVAAVLAPTQSAAMQVFVAPQIAEDMEAFLDGFAVARLALPGRPATERHLIHSSVRLYADRLESVPSLAVGVEGLGYQVVSQAAEIERLLLLGRRLDQLVAVTGVLLLVGYVSASSANLIAVFDRQRRHMALLRLMGATRATLVQFVLGFGLVTGLCGALVALGLFGAFCTAINQWIPLDLGTQRPSCSLGAGPLAAAVAATLALVGVVTLVVARRFARIPPAGALHAD